MTHQVARHHWRECTKPVLPERAEHFEFVHNPVPCDGCSHANACGERQLACEAFAEYVRTGQWKIRDARRLPTRRPYLRLFRH